MNRAVQGDVVVVEVFDEKEWKAPADEVVDQDCSHPYSFLKVFLCSYIHFLATLKNDDAEDSGEEGDENDDITTREKKAIISHTTKRTSERQPTGRIVGVIKRNWRACVSPSHCTYPMPRIKKPPQLRMSHRQYISNIIQSHLPLPTNSLRNSCLSAAPTYPTANAASTLSHWAEDPCYYRPVGRHVSVS